MGEIDEQTKVLVLVELCSSERNNHLKKKNHIVKMRFVLWRKEKQSKAEQNQGCWGKGHWGDHSGKQAAKLGLTEKVTFTQEAKPHLAVTCWKNMAGRRRN